MKSITKRAVLLISCMLLMIGCGHRNVLAAGHPSVYAVNEAVEELDDGMYLIPLYISDNTGIMGFRIQLESVSESVKIHSIAKGTVTNSGSFDSDVKASGATVVHVLWSAVENVVSDGTLMYIGVSVQDEKVQEIQIHVSYEQEDTFNENYQDVELLCQDIQISLGDSGDDSGELTSGTDATAGTTEALVAGSDEWAQTSEENAAKNNAIEVIAYNSLEEEVGEDDIKDAVCKGLAAYGIDELDRIPDGEEDTFYELVRTYLKADADSNHKLIDKLDMELAVSHVKLDQSDKNRIRDYIEQGVPEPEPEQTSIRRYLVLGIALGLLLLVSIPVCIGRIRHGKTKK